ncbi:MAG: hypothetical protein JWN41_1722, partial [Thermoleophilia bacterium]|nr:hypothetical protein [Thermoleophilia bacterium]
YDEHRLLGNYAAGEEEQKENEFKIFHNR